MTRPNHPDSSEPISIIEDLDPDPVRGPGLRLDLLLGVSLLLIVVVFAMWQWWHQDYQSSQYHAGQEAMGRSDLDSALHYFTEASGYNDADVLAQYLRKEVTDRDRLYQSAIAHAGEWAWLPALLDLRAAGKIQPDYKDLKARGEDALQHVYTDALSSTVVMREGAKPPGLYYRTASGWAWLDGSDTRSYVLDMVGRTTIIYDVPNKNATLTPTPQRGTGGKPDDYNKERRVSVARLVGNSLRFSPLKVDPAYYVPTVFGETGFWAVHHAGYLENDGLGNDESGYINPVVRDQFQASNLIYQPYSGVTGAILRIMATDAISTGSTLVSVDSASNRYLLAEWTGARASGPDANTTINLYLCVVGSSEKRLIYTQMGGSIQSAMLSPDGRYVVLHTYQDSGPDPQINDITALLLDLSAGGSPHTLKASVTNKNVRMEPQALLKSAFVQQGVFAGKLLLAEYDSGYNSSPPTSRFSGPYITIRLIDPAKAALGQVDASVLAATTIRWTTETLLKILQQDGDGVVLLGRPEGWVGNSAMQATLISFPALGQPTSYDIPVPGEQGILSARVLDNLIIWSDQQYGSYSNTIPPVRSINSLPLGGEASGSTELSPTLVLTTRGGTAGRGIESGAFDAINLGDNLIAYSLNGELHARTYDGKYDLLLEARVPYIFENNSPYSYNVMLR